MALARRNGNSKREFSADRRLDPRPHDETAAAAPAKGMDWMYAYDPRAA